MGLAFTHWIWANDERDDDDKTRTLYFALVRILCAIIVRHLPDDGTNTVPTTTFVSACVGEHKQKTVLRMRLIVTNCRFNTKHTRICTEDGRLEILYLFIGPNWLFLIYWMANSITIGILLVLNIVVFVASNRLYFKSSRTRDLWSMWTDIENISDWLDWRQQVNTTASIDTALWCAEVDEDVCGRIAGWGSRVLQISYSIRTTVTT